MTPFDPQQSPSRHYVSTAIPYVNAAPHVGFVFEAVLTDALARYARQRGHAVHSQTGTDDHSLKNVKAAAARGVTTRGLVSQNAARFAALGSTFDLSFDRFVRTADNPLHAATVAELWRRCAERGDIYRRPYEGLYCVGCEQFYRPSDLERGRCPEHATEPELVREDNYFFRLSRYQDALADGLRSGRIRIAPRERSNEALSFVAGGLEDISISRSRTRAGDWGLPVPGDPSQVIYVWFDALANYLTGLGGFGAAALDSHWTRASRIQHVVGKGILRFHAVYWPAILLSAGLRADVEILVHGYLTVEGKKIGKSLGNALDPFELAQEYGGEAVRYYLLRHLHSTEDSDFSRERLERAYNSELANQLGNLVQRTASLVVRYRDGRVPEALDVHPRDQRQRERLAHARRAVARAVEAFALHEALRAVWELVAETNRYAEAHAPWNLARAERTDDRARRRLDTTLCVLVESVRLIASLLEPFLPRAAQRIAERVGARSTRETGPPGGAIIQEGPPLFPRRSSHLADKSSVSNAG